MCCVSALRISTEHVYTFAQRTDLEGTIMMRPFFAKLLAILASIFILPAVSGAQQSKKDTDIHGMPGMDDGQTQGMHMGGNDLMTMHPATFFDEIVRHGTSGTSAEPNSTPVPCS
jgi:hypothetical protein